MMYNVFEQIAIQLAAFYMFDLAVFSSVWLYLPLGIPFIFYLMFFIMKWTVLMLPIWYPLHLIFRKKAVEKEDSK